MSGYDFDEVSVNKGVYCPRGLGNVEQELHAISRGFLEVLDGKRGIPVWVLDPSSPEIRASELESGDPHPALRETQPKNEILNMPQRYTFPPRLTDPPYYSVNVITLGDTRVTWDVVRPHGTSLV